MAAHQAGAQYSTAVTPPPGDNSNRVPTTEWVNGAILPAIRLSSCAKGDGVDDGAKIQQCVNAASAAGKSLFVDTPPYRDPQGNPAWVICASPNNDGHGIELPASIQIIAAGWPVRIETKPGCASPPTDVFFAPTSTSTSKILIRDLVIDGYGLAIPMNATGWARPVLDHVNVRNGLPGSLATFVNGDRTNVNVDGLRVIGGSWIENVNDSGHTLYWGSWLQSVATSGQNQIVLPSIPPGLIPGGAVDLLNANGVGHTCTGSASSAVLSCNATTSMTVGDRVIIPKGGAISTTLGANANVNDTAVTLASVNGIVPGDTIAISGAGSAGGTLNTTVSSTPTITTAPAGTVSIANPIVTGVSSGTAANLTTPFFSDIISIAGGSCPCNVTVALPLTGNPNGIVIDPTPGFNFAASAMPLSVAVAYACQISGTTVSLSTSPTDLTCASPYNLPINQLAGTWVGNLPIFAAMDVGADSQWSNVSVVAGARSALIEETNESDPQLVQVHSFGPPPLSGQYGIEITGGGSCVSCQNDKAMLAGALVGNKSTLANASLSGFMLVAGNPPVSLQKLGVLVETGAVGAQIERVQQVVGSNAVISPAQVVLQAGVTDATETIDHNLTASYAYPGVACPSGVTAGTVTTSIDGTVTHC